MFFIRRYYFIAALCAVIAIIAAGIVLQAGINSGNANRDMRIIDGKEILINDENILSSIQAAITAKNNDTIERDIIVCKKIDRYYFALIQYRHYDQKLKGLDGGAFNTVYAFEDLGSNRVNMLAQSSSEMAYSPGFGIGYSRYGDYYIIYGNLNKTAWVPENDTRRDTNYSKMVVTYNDGKTSEENIYGHIGYVVVSKAPNAITGFTLYDKDGKTTKDDKCDMQYIKNLNAETEFHIIEKFN